MESWKSVSKAPLSLMVHLSVPVLIQCGATVILIANLSVSIDHVGRESHLPQTHWGDDCGRACCWQKSEVLWEVLLSQTPILVAWTSCSNFSLRALREIWEFAVKSRAFLMSSLENASFLFHPVLLNPLTVTAGGQSGMNRLGRKFPSHPHCVIGRDGSLL